LLAAALIARLVAGLRLLVSGLLIRLLTTAGLLVSRLVSTLSR
jgi:hypothetical protein